DDVAERRLDGAATAEGSAALGDGVAAGTIGQSGKVAALLDLIELLLVRMTRPISSRSDGERGTRAERRRYGGAARHGPAAPDFSGTGCGSPQPTRGRAPRPCRSGCNRRSAGRRWLRARTGSVRPSSAGND